MDAASQTVPHLARLTIRNPPIRFFRPLGRLCLAKLEPLLSRYVVLFAVADLLEPRSYVVKGQMTKKNVHVLERERHCGVICVNRVENVFELSFAFSFPVLFKIWKGYNS